MKINLWYSKSMSQWRWTLVEEWRNGVTKSEQHSGQQPFLRDAMEDVCLLYTSPSPRDRQKSRMPSSA